MSKGPIVTGIGNHFAVQEILTLDRDALARWRCECGALTTGPKCGRGHPAPWAGELVAAEKQRRAAVLRAWRVRVGITMSPEQRATWLEQNRLRRLASEAKRRERYRLSGTNGYRTREGYLAYLARYNETRAEAKRIAERDRYWRKKAARSGGGHDG